jgi:hypothetical protein
MSTQLARDIRVASGGDLGAGQIQFYQAIQPPLASNLYRLNAAQTIALKSEQPSYTLQQPFSIAGPRFRLQSANVQQVYPPANLTGSYEECLPHIVLRQRTLPWCRTIDGSVARDGEVPTPWLALLTLYPEDLTANGQPAALADLVKQTTVGDLLTANTATVIPPSIDRTSLSADELAEPLLAIELPQSVFWTIAPTLAELPYLAHARQVNTDGKELLGLDADGFFSLVMGNRFPKPAAANVVLFVSLEGHQAHLPVDGQPAPAAAATHTVRLAVLASWSFTSAPARGDFLQIMQDLPKRGGVDLLQMPHDDFSGQLTPAATTARKALELGYLPLLSNTRSGEETTSWYRGPGAPVPCAIDPGPYLYSDHAIRYDPGPDSMAYAGTGMFDVSYACAWQIGRLLALSDAAFAASLLEWRRRQYVDQNQQQTMADLSERVPVPAARVAAVAAAAPGPPLDAAKSAVAMFLHAAAPAIQHSQLPKALPHERRADASLAGVLSPTDLLAAIEAPGDPLYNLVQRVLALEPAPRSGEPS